ncbi:ATP-binding cassette domain-containing protein, partial [Planctomycetota bacterium]
MLRGADLEVQRGELVIVAGPSGSGKSTLLCVMGGLLSPDAGKVRVFGRDIGGADQDQVRDVRRRRVGFVF